MKIINNKNLVFINKIISILFLISGSVYLIFKTFTDRIAVDFKYIWVAGRVWNEGNNPYSDYYSKFASTIFHNTSVPAGWVYPPSWSFIAMPISLIPFETASLLWNIALAFLLLISIWFIYKSINIEIKKSYWNLFWLAGFAFMMEATPINLSLGQTSILILFGISILVYNYIHESIILSAIGLALIMLKPQIGIIFIPALLFYSNGIFIILIACIITIILCLPAFFQIGIISTFSHMILRLSEYYTGFGYNINTNGPAETTSIRTIIDYLMGYEINSIILIVLAVIISLVTGLILRKKRINKSILFYYYICFIISLISFFMVLHIYDLIIIIPLLLILPNSNRYTILIFSIGFLLIFRAGNLASYTGILYNESVNFKGSVLASFGLLLIFICMIIEFYYYILKMNKNIIAQNKQKFD